MTFPASSNCGASENKEIVQQLNLLYTNHAVSYSIWNDVGPFDVRLRQQVVSGAIHTMPFTHSHHSFLLLFCFHFLPFSLFYLKKN